MKHTLGPWHRNISADGKYPTVFAGRNHHVAVASQQKDSAETEANISLIAAAPDLLAACIEATAIFDNYPQTQELVGTYQVLMSAIAKAIGEAEQ